MSDSLRGVIGSRHTRKKLYIFHSCWSTEKHSEYVGIVAPWFASAERVSALSKYPSLAMPGLEKWLRTQGPAADPLVLASGPSPASALQLVEACSGFTSRSETAGFTTPLGTAGAGAGAGVTPYLVIPPDLSGSECDQRERSSVLVDAQEVAAAPASISAVSTLLNTARTDPKMLHAAVTCPSVPAPLQGWSCPI